MQDAATVSGKRTDHVTLFGRNLSAKVTCRFDAGDRHEPRPARLQAKEVEPVEFTDCGAAPGLDPAMPLVQRLVQRDLSSAVPWCVQRREEVPQRFRQMRLVVLHRQNVVATARRDLRGNRRLAAHGIDRHHRAFQRQGWQQFFDRRDFVRFLFAGALSQGQPIVGGIGRYLMQRPQTALRARRPAQGFAVDRDDSPLHCRTNFTHPRFEAPLQFHRRQCFEDPANRVVTGNAVAQSQVAPQPRFSLTPPVLNVVPAFRTGHDGTQCDNDNIQQIVVRPPFHPRIGQVGKPFNQSCYPRFLVHPSPRQITRVDAISPEFTSPRHKLLIVALSNVV